GGGGAGPDGSFHSSATATASTRRLRGELVATNGDARFDPRAQARAVSSLVSVGIVVLALVAVYSSFAVIKPGNVGVVFNRWSGSLRAAGQGIVWRIPWFTQVQSYPIALRTFARVARSKHGSA